jgi:hypothetical protein
MSAFTEKKLFKVAISGIMNHDGTGQIQPDESYIYIEDGINIDGTPKIQKKILNNIITFNENGLNGDPTFLDEIVEKGGSRKSSRKTKRKRYLGKGKSGKSRRRK